MIPTLTSKKILQIGINTNYIFLNFINSINFRLIIPFPCFPS